MKTLDELATAAVDELHQQAAGAAQTDAMLAELRRGETLFPTVPTPIKDRGHRRVLVIGAAAAACVALIAGLTVLRGSDSRVRPVDGGSTDAPVTGPTPTSAPVSKATFAAPVMDISTGSEIVYQFREQTIDCGQGETCASGLLAPMVATDNRIVIGDALRHRWLVATDEGTDMVEFDPSWALLDAAMAPDNSVYAVFVADGQVVLYRYADAVMDAPLQADYGRDLDACCTPAVFLDVGGRVGGSPDFVDYQDGVFVVHRPASLARPSLTLDDATLANEVLVEFTDGVQHTYLVGTGGNGRLLDGTLHSLTGRAVVIQQTDGVNTQRLLTVLLHDGSTFERRVPLTASAAVNEQRFVDEGYLYELTAVPVYGQPQWVDYAVRRWALPNEATTPPATTVPPPDTGTATPTTPAPTAPGLVTGHSIDGAAFGDEVDSALAVLTATFSQPYSDETTELPLRVGQHWENDQYASFGNEHARQVCWQPANSSPLCVWFGSDGNDPLRLVGWSTGAESINGVSIAAASGLTIGSKWSDHLAEVVLPPGSNCYNTGYAHTADGMNVELWSGTEMFVTIDSTGAISQNNPPPQTVIVGRLSAGDALSDTRSDC